MAAVARASQIRNNKGVFWKNKAKPYNRPGLDQSK